MPINVIILVASMFLVASGYTMVIPFLPLYLKELGVPDESISLWAGLVFSACFLVGGIMGPIWGKMADSQGKKLMALRASFLLGISYFFCGMAQDEYQLMAARAFQGFANGFVAAAMAIISDSVEENKLGVTLGIAQTALVVGGIVGPLMGGAISFVIGMKNTFYLSGILLWIVSVLTFIFVKDKHMEHKAAVAKTSIIEDLCFAAKEKHLRELLMVSFFLQSTILMIQSITTLYIGEFVKDPEHLEVIAGFIMSIGGVAGALTTALWGKLGQTRGYYLTMSITLFSAGIITIVQSFPESIYGVGICQFLAGCFIIGTNPSLNASLIKFTPENFRGRIFGLSNTTQQFGNVFGPLLAAGVSMLYGIREVYVVAGLIQLALGFQIWRSHLIHRT